MSSHDNLGNFRRKQGRAVDPVALGVGYVDAMAENVRLVRACAHRGETQYVMPAAVAAALNDAHREQGQMNLNDVREFMGGLTAGFAQHLAACPATDPEGHADIWARMLNSDANATRERAADARTDQPQTGNDLGLGQAAQVAFAAFLDACADLADAMHGSEQPTNVFTARGLLA